ncbi:hypothetical protein DACRYDRAFT_20718 [Dacryopinax primogenitus]|uniref:Peptidase C14 caspase domain-containing protein n=1 Tax=Dacryopinax primogenitus (strain DJM 731) TaxID=1858805 RepID=M5G5Q6_DACPD|nr:uncharacterized protein DACRYDRAFT_20718 [Dacryopinax primogenitus]EJU04044.1 hypothetical protein DACRYDRAFT_20718 [Dacryopinax primogenitus]
MPRPTMLRDYSINGNPPRERWFAVLIGIRYRDHPNEVQLEHTHDDVDQFRRLLIDIGYPEENIRVFMDGDDDPPDTLPTRTNIIVGIKWLAERATRDPENGYKLMFYYAGHGHQQVDPTHKEKDGLNEAIVPMDANIRIEKTLEGGRGRGKGRYRKRAPRFRVIPNNVEDNGCIIDDELNELMAKPLPARNRLVAIFDCCHSGTALDLKHEYLASEVPFSFRCLFKHRFPQFAKAIRWKTKTDELSELYDPVLGLRLLPMSSRRHSLPCTKVSVTRAFGLERDQTIGKGVGMVVSTSRWTFSGVRWVYGQMFCRSQRTVPGGVSNDESYPAAASISTTLSQVDAYPVGLKGQHEILAKNFKISSRFNMLRHFLSGSSRQPESASSALHRTIPASPPETLYHEESVVFGTFLQLEERVKLSDDDVVADVIAIGACSDDEETLDSRSLAKVLVRFYNGNLAQGVTYAELFLWLSRRASPKRPELSSSREMTRERWGQFFDL